MENQKTHPIEKPMEVQQKISDLLLDDINKVNDSARGLAFQTTELSKSWNSLRATIHPGEEKDKFNSLVEEYQQDKRGWINCLHADWIDTGAKRVGQIEFARLAAIRMLSIIAGKDASVDDGNDVSFADIVFEMLWSIIENKEQDFTVDARFWALLSLDSCNVEMDAALWDKTFGTTKIEGESNSAYWLEKVPEATIRATSFKAIGKMAKFSEIALCWEPLNNGNCHQQLDHCRLNANLFEEVEGIILTHWSREIDYTVKRELIDALSHVAGWTMMPKPDSWNVIDMLREATNLPDEKTRSRVPFAIRSIATNIIHRQDDISINQRSKMIKWLIDLAIDNVKQIERVAVNKRYSQGYNIQRQYILTMRYIALKAQSTSMLSSEQIDEIINLVVEGLFLIVTDQEFENNSTLRNLSLHILDELAKHNEWTRQEANQNYRLLMADPDPEVAEAAANNIVNLLGDKDAANVFLEIIIEDKSTDDAILNRIDNWNAGEESDLDFLKNQIRSRAAEALGAIKDNNAAHDKLVEMLRSDPINSGRARDALLIIGGERGVESIVKYNLQQQVNDKFFQPMEKAQDRGWQLLEDVRGWADNNYRHAHKAALFTMVGGIIIFFLSIIYMFLNIDLHSNEIDSNLIIGPGIGLLASIGGALGTHLWEPVKGLNKVAAELSRIIMSFENYLGRMRLIGLGFAHAYTQNNFEELAFLSQISDIVAKAMHESAISLNGIGSDPIFDTGNQFVTIPKLVDKPLGKVRDIVKMKKLELEISESAYVLDKIPGTIVNQNPLPGMRVSVGSKIKVTPSTNQQAIGDVPDFIGKPILESLEIVKENGLVITSLIFQFDANVEEGTIINQDIRPGLSVTHGTAVNLTIAKKAESLTE